MFDDQLMKDHSSYYENDEKVLQNIDKDIDNDD